RHTRFSRDWSSDVCSSDLQRRQDHAITHAGEIGCAVSTDPAEVRRVLNRRRNRPLVVFCTYQSSDVLATAMKRTRFAFDLLIARSEERRVGKESGSGRSQW